MKQFSEKVYLELRMPTEDVPVSDHQRIRLALMEGVTEIAVALPEHTVIPYKNIGRRNYPKNK